MARIFISAAHKSSGKTTVAAGLCAALARRGRHVRPFKKGPDYIDPMWLSRAAGRACINLDFHTMSAAEIRAAAAPLPGAADEFAVIEGNKGLFDGVDLAGRDSNAALAKHLGAPVILALDARGMTRGAAPLLLGYRAFDPQVNLAGVILNHTGGARHEAKLRAAIAHYTDIPVLGAVRADAQLNIAERHLGLMTCAESSAADEVVDALADAVAAQVDLDAVAAIAERAASPDHTRFHTRVVRSDLTVAIARDAAFNFYYADDLAAFADYGARLAPFDALNDAELPAADGLVIGGGFPETHAAQLAANAAMRESVRGFVAAGKPVYAECGGLMYLARELAWRGEVWEMAGALPARIEMTERPVGRGYVRLEETAHAPWPAVDGLTTRVGPRVWSGEIPAHEFHYSRIELPADAKFAYRVRRGHGINGEFDGWAHGNVLANYSHFRHTAANPWVARFVAFVRACKTAAESPARAMAAGR